MGEWVNGLGGGGLHAMLPPLTSASAPAVEGGTTPSVEGPPVPLASGCQASTRSAGASLVYTHSFRNGTCLVALAQPSAATGWEQKKGGGWVPSNNIHVCAR